jgi:hypothetical protein
MSACTWRSISFASVLQCQEEDPLVLDVLQPCAAEIADLDAVRDVVPDQRPRRLREQNLAAVACGADAGGTHDVHPEVALLAHDRLSRMQTHPYLHLRSVRPCVRRELALGGHRSPHGVFRAWEREEERIALCIDLLAARSMQLLAEDAPVIAVNLLVAVAQLLEEPSRALDVREVQGDGAAGELFQGRR